MVTTPSPQPSVRLEDYRPFPFKIPNTELNVVIQQHDVLVTADLHLEPVLQSSEPLLLQGVDLELISVSLDGHALPADAYSLGVDTLQIHVTPNQPFTVTTV